jgi:small GTP-binding protein
MPYKVVLLGDSWVGKSSIIVRFTEGKFDPNCQATVRAGVSTKKLPIGRRSITLNIWDTAGQEVYHSLAPIYCKGAHAALLVYSVTDDGSFQRARDWNQELHHAIGDDVKVYVVANKIDLEPRIVSSDRGCQFADSIGCKHFPVSAKTGDGVEMLFQFIGQDLVMSGVREDLEGFEKRAHAKGTLDLSQDDGSSACC